MLEVSYGLGGKPSAEYKAAYLRKLRKQVQQKAAAQASGNSTALRALSEVSDLPPAPSDADALITRESKSDQVQAAYG